jgi:hypothetical protein
MNKQQLSPEKYIQTRVRSLPLYKCFVTGDWEEFGMANVVVMRKHINGNVTSGLYLVDLFCLGIKDTFYFFNEPEEELFEKINIERSYLQEADYNLAHNIIYAGHDFALEFDIQPHKNFSITKFILEEDNDAIPVIDIRVGDENGNPYLVVNSSYNYGPVLEKLKKHAGEGNYTFTLAKDEYDEDEWDDEEDKFGEEDEWDDEEDAFDEEDKWDDEQFLDNIEPNFLDFNNIAEFETDLLQDALETHLREPLDEMIIKTELLWRRLSEEKPELMATEDYLRNTKEFKRYDDKIEQWRESSEKNLSEREKAFQELKSLAGNNKETGIQEYINLLLQYSFDETTAAMIFHGIPMLVLLPSIEELQNHFSKFPPAVQLAITAYSIVLQKESYDKHQLITEAKTVEEVYKRNKDIHAYHHKYFWFMKALNALQQDDQQKILHYHALLRIVGTGGHIRYLYAARLNEWLSKFMHIDEDSFLIPEYEE